jgi:hypothetical protein
MVVPATIATSMRLEDLVRALVTHDPVSARQWVADAARSRFQWAAVPRPVGLDQVSLAVAAGVAEMLAERAGQRAPEWALGVPELPEPFLLVRAAATMPRLRHLCETEGPEPLRRRRLLAPPEFLTAA